MTAQNFKATTNEISFADLLDKAISEPGIVSSAFHAFHGYSIGNQMLAMMQCMERGIKPGPIATFKGWQAKSRFVMKGQKALCLCMPVTGKTTEEDASTGEQTNRVFTRFVYRNNWFVLGQTDGAEYTPTGSIGEWDRALAIETLKINVVPFEMMDGNTQGYAFMGTDRKLAINPVAVHPDKTLFHEIAHILLGHTAENQMNDNDRTPRTIREVEAEAVAMIVGEVLGLPGVEDSRGYIQNWNHSGEPISEKSAQKIFKVANQILTAGKATSAEAIDA